MAACTIVLLIIAALLNGAETNEMSDRPIDWSEWNEQLHHQKSATANSSPAISLDVVAAGPKRDTYHLVDECARRLELRNVDCVELSEGIDDHRVPFMESDDVACGFQVRPISAAQATISAL